MFSLLDDFDGDGQEQDCLHVNDRLLKSAGYGVLVLKHAGLKMMKREKHERGG